MTLSRITVTWFSLGLAIALALFLWVQGGVLGVPRAIAQSTESVESLQQEQQRLEQERQQVQEERDRLENLEGSATERLDGLQSTLRATTEQIQYNEEQLQIANQRLSSLVTALAAAEDQYQEQQFATVARLRYLQRQPSQQGWALLLQSQNLNDFMTRRRQLKLVYQSDRIILGDLKVHADEIDRQRRTIARQKNEIALLTQELLAQRSEVEAQAQNQQALISRLRDDREALEEAEEQLSRDSANIAVLIQQRMAVPSGRGPVVRGTGQFSYPNDGFITSSFGWRSHPILGYERFHAGVDFGSDYGSTIRAADSGVVIYADWYGGYGLSVIVDHGGGLTTLYAHSSDLYVTEGQSVQRGQAIAAVGSTGLSTGPHLHFEVRANGEPVDPMQYL
ncbi:MAG: peptidoglycan DD-metalloendopeptidase family protein [Elainellaceae cyanobacterium]